MEKVNFLIKKFELHVSNIQPAVDSFSSEVYQLELVTGENLYLKIPFNKKKFFRECRLLQQLQQVLPVPKVIQYWEGNDQTSGAMLLSAIPGQPCNTIESIPLAEEIGELLARLHLVEMPGYGDIEPEGFCPVANNDWRQYIKTSFESWCQPCQEIMDEKLYKRCILLFEKMFSLLPEPDGPCLVHLDFRPGNILVHDGQVSGIIDFESARGGSSEIDFTKVNRYYWEKQPDTKIAFIRGYTRLRPILDLDQVIPFYSLYDSLGAVAWCQRRGIKENIDFLEENLDVLRKLVD